MRHYSITKKNVKRVKRYRGRKNPQIATCAEITKEGQMTKKVEVVLKGFLALSATEKSDLISEIQRYQNGTTQLKEHIEKSICDTTINFGPAFGNCPCCGR